MFRIFKVMLASFAVATLGVAGLDVHVARADWNKITVDWDESAPVVKTLDPDDETALADHFFHVEWAAGPGASGNDVGSVVAPVGEAVPGHGRTYFDVAVPSSRFYRVDVASFDFVELPG